MDSRQETQRDFFKTGDRVLISGRITNPIGNRGRQPLIIIMISLGGLLNEAGIVAVTVRLVFHCFSLGSPRPGGELLLLFLSVSKKLLKKPGTSASKVSSLPLRGCLNVR